MLSAVSPVHFGQKSPEELQLLINRDGKYAQAPSQMVAPLADPEPKKSHKGLFITLGTLIVLATGAGLLINAFRKDKLSEFENPANTMEKIKNLAFKTGKKLNEWYDAFINMFKKEKINNEMK